MSLSDAYSRRLIAFHFTETEPRDKDGKWTKVPGSGAKKGEVQGQSKGKMWSGISADSVERVKPKPTTRMDEFKSNKAALTFAKRIFDANLGDGYTSNVEGVRRTDNSVFVEGRIFKNGREAGTFDRILTTNDNGSLSVYHDGLLLDRPHQGSGVGDRFNTHAVQEYQKLGVDRIELTAGDTVGGFAWARQGFQYDESHNSESKQTWMLRQLKRVRVNFNRPVVRPHAKQLETEIKGLEAAVKAGKDVQPIHLASLGEKYARWNAMDDWEREYQTWPGKQLLLGQVWRGVYYFDAAHPITAAASDLAHAQLRPQFYADVETHVIASFFARCEHGNLTAACHDASCRPPTSGGTGGSRPRGSAGSPSKPLSSADGPTKFGQMINGLIDASNLFNLSKSAVQGVHESALENALRVDLKAHHDIYRAVDSMEIAAPYHLRGEPQFQALADAKRAILQRSDDSLKLPARQDWSPKNKYEKIILDLAKEHMVKDDPYYATQQKVYDNGEISGVGGHITLTIKGINKPRKTVMSYEHIIPDDAESRTTSIGTIIRDEINKRSHEQFDVMEHTNIWNDATEKAMAIVAKTRPADGANANNFEIWLKNNAIPTGTGPDRHLSLMMLSGLKPDDRAAIESIFKRSRISATSLVGHIRNGQAETHQSVMWDVLSEIRPMGGEFADTPRHRSPKFKSSLSVNKQITRAAPWYPADWIKASNDDGSRVEFKSSTSRAHYRHGLVAEVKLDGTVRTAVHELGHRMEYTVPGVRVLEQQFYDRRTAGEPLEQLSKLSPGSRYGKDERARKDQFFNPYVGKTYEGRAYEIISMGMESLPYRHSWDKMDPDYQAFILGALATAYR